MPTVAEGAQRLGLNRMQGAVVASLLGLLVAGFCLDLGLTWLALMWLGQALFVACAIWRIVLALASGKVETTPHEPLSWPRYTVLAALHDEADVVQQLASRLAAIDYPEEQLQGFLVLEAHDQATIDAAEAAERPSWLNVLIVPPGAPRTKPRALNHALQFATGDIVTIYDAEDEPDPLQLREAAARFVADPDLGCVQAPLRIRQHMGRERAPMFDRQFAFEYASLFEVTLPGMARLGLPFPLGGTSNHIRMDALRPLGGWDAYNVTEDADLGFRLWREGWRLGIIRRPTYETPPGELDIWLPQRTRWLKGYMQTLGVHTRSFDGLGPKGVLALAMTLGAALISAAAHATALGWLVSAVLIALVAGVSPATPVVALSVLFGGVASAWISCALGARRAGLTYGVKDMVSAPVYWSMLTLAFGHAAWRLISEPFVWDKTPHRREDRGEESASPTSAINGADAGRRAA
ncbi:glycosyltransferase [Brevundimonas sp. PAMC22021]|nr:glycosyltransferase [Brevundimonas sp. PAMC22021]